MNQKINACGNIMLEFEFFTPNVFMYVDPSELGDTVSYDTVAGGGEDDVPQMGDDVYEEDFSVYDSTPADDKDENVTYDSLVEQNAKTAGSQHETAFAEKLDTLLSDIFV